MRTIHLGQGGRTDTKLSAMAALPLFAGCTRRQLVQLGRLFDSATVSAGGGVEPAGAAGKWLYVLVDGEALAWGDGASWLTRPPGDHWGQESALEREAVATTTMALTRLRVLCLERRCLGAVARCAPAVAARLGRPSQFHRTSRTARAPRIGIPKAMAS